MRSQRGTLKIKISYALHFFTQINALGACNEELSVIYFLYRQ